MKITDIVVNALMRTSVFEQAYHRRQALDILISLQDHIALHLVKLYMYADSQSVNHWQSELNAAFARVNRVKVKSSGQRLDANTLRDYLFEQPLGTIADVQQFMNDIARSPEYRDLHIDQPDAAVIHKQIWWLADDIVHELAPGTFEKISK